MYNNKKKSGFDNNFNINTTSKMEGHWTSDVLGLIPKNPQRKI